MLIEAMHKPTKRPKTSLFGGLVPAIIMIVFFLLVVIVTLYYRHRIAELVGAQ
jgi:hypothetical protein